MRANEWMDKRDDRVKIQTLLSYGALEYKVRRGDRGVCLHTDSDTALKLKRPTAFILACDDGEGGKYDPVRTAPI